MAVGPAATMVGPRSREKSMTKSCAAQFSQDCTYSITRLIVSLRLPVYIDSIYPPRIADVAKKRQLNLEFAWITKSRLQRGLSKTAHCRGDVNNLSPRLNFGRWLSVHACS